MAQVQCVDGRTLGLVPQPCLDRRGVAFEVTLRLLVDGAAFGDVGERCGGRLTALAERLRAARDTDGRQAFPAEPRVTGRDPELVCLRSRDPDDVPSDAEIRVWLRDERVWQPGTGGARGRWSLTCQAVVDAWGAQGQGVRAVLDSDALAALLDVLVEECERASGAS